MGLDQGPKIGEKRLAFAEIGQLETPFNHCAKQRLDCRSVAEMKSRLRGEQLKSRVVAYIVDHFVVER